MRVTPLNRKLLRDVWAMKGQASAIGLVIACGIAMFVMYLSNFGSLDRTRQAYYEHYRFADLFAATKRAPERLRERLRAIPGVTEAETRVVADVVLDVPGLDEPASGRLISVPATSRPRLNDLHLSEGRWVSESAADEVIASEAFAEANGFHVGDAVSAIVNGRRRRLTIVGVALSPEYVYSIRPGEIVPDARRFGVFWMERRALASAFDMEGAFNDVVLALGPEAVEGAVIAELDRLLEPYGSRGATPRALQFSNWTLESELTQLRTFGFLVPAIFLLVAAFVLNIALTRALALQRPQLAALKALGYTNAELAWHYVKWALIIALGGALVGIVGGAWMGTGMIQLYNQYFRFPTLYFQLAPGVVVGALFVALGAAALGAATSVRRAVRIPPAEAMRPEPPARFRRSLIEAAALQRRLPTALRMVFRNLERHPARALSSIIGIAMAAAIFQFGVGFVDAMEQLIETQFSIAERQDVTLTFVEPASPEVRHAVSRLPGVLLAEPQRVVPARLRAGPRQRTLAITGVPVDAELRRIVDLQGDVMTLPAGGVVLSEVLAHVLDVGPGDAIRAEVLEGRQPVLTLQVSGVVDDTFGISAFMALDELHRLMREAPVWSTAALLVDRGQEPALLARLKALPTVAGVAVKQVVIDNFRRTLAENMGLMLTFNVGFAGIIAFGVVYNAARVSLSERSRELASLRVLGFTRGEISLILLGELAVLTLAALPVGAVVGAGLTAAMVESFKSEIYRFPLVVTPRVMALAALVVITAALVSGLVVRRRLDRLDLVGVLKIRE
jgi:putative ABC transport system permease protein